MEIWKPIKNFEDYYIISNNGRIQRTAGGQGARPGLILKTKNDKYGYPTVELHIHNHRYRRYVHILLVSTFIGDIPKGYEVNHKDGNKTNLHLSNLEIVTRQENVEHAWKLGLTDNSGSKCGSAKLTNEQILGLRTNFVYSKGIYTRLAKQLNVSVATISRIIHKETYKCV